MIKTIDIEEAKEYIVGFPPFSYSGNWRWYRDDEALGILEIYGNGTLTFSVDVMLDLCLIGGGGGGGKSGNTN